MKVVLINPYELGRQPFALARADAPTTRLAADRAWEVPVGPPGRPGRRWIGCL